MNINEVIDAMRKAAGELKGYSSPPPRQLPNVSEPFLRALKAKSILSQAPISVLLVDDDEDQLNLFTTVLRVHGFYVYRARSALEAMKILEYESIDVVLTDLIMPTMNGEKLIITLRSMDKLYPSGQLPV